ncbi:hypothetical protein Prudu_019255 [Prunus dulcis]|uniref:Integrase catalytic domain-containing protein n=1 Tax=Prunus dulcis TaxID=3755 RepID=A0A4Y1RSK7_PRUDU|nr:hypothetical protein Prudu_019255 [Prunus dulcis]
MRLNDDNFVKWNYQLESVLQGYDLYGHFDGSSVCPSKYVISESEGVTTELTESYRQWIQVDKSLLSLLLATLSDEAIEYVIGCKSARDAWLSLTDRYASVSRARVNQLKTELHTIHKGGDSVEKFLLRLKHIRDQLAAAGFKLSDDDIIIAALNGLPQEFDMIKTVLIARETPIALKEFRAQLLSVEKNIESRMLAMNHSMTGMMSVSPFEIGSSSHSQDASQTQGTASTVGTITPHPQASFSMGFNRNKSQTNTSHGAYQSSDNTSHGAYQSSEFSPSSYQPNNTSGSTNHFVPRGRGSINGRFHNHNSNRGDNSSTPILECQICGKKGHIALNCYHRANFAYQGAPPPQSIQAMTANLSYTPNDLWIADSGASHHMTPNVHQLQASAPYSSEDKITIGNGEGQSDKGLYPIPQVHPQPSQIHKSPLHSSISVIANKDAANNKALSLLPAAQGNSRPHALLGQQVKTKLWHLRLGHSSNDVLHHMLKVSNIPLSVDSTTEMCDSCLQGKMHKLPFSSSSTTSLRPFTKLHTDVWGPSNVAALGGYRYFLTIIDDCTRYMWVFPLINKSEVSSVFIKFHAYIVTHYQAQVQFLQSDGGGEYISHMFKSFLASKGILHQLSCPYTPQQNGLAERKNRHLIETTLALLTTAGLSLPFWFYAVTHAAFLINRMPSRVLNMLSPYYKLFGGHPDLLSLKIFGSAVYPLLRPYTAHKLEPRSYQCIFLGYSMGYKGVLCYDLRTHKVLISRHVIHNEDVYPVLDNQMLPVFTDAQLEVLLPLESASLIDNPGPLPAQVHPASSINNHPMQTRSKSGSWSSSMETAMTEEIQALDQQGTWTLVPSPPNTNINADGTLSRYKARLVAQGFSQEYGLDYEETFSPVVRHTTVRLILGLAVNFQWELRQLDVKNAFLHGELQEEVFMKQPQGFVDSQYPNHVCKLQKSLYGLKQAPRAWNAKFTGYLPTLGFSVSHSDPSLFVKKTEVAVVILLLYVDDIIITGSDPSLVTSVIQALSEVFELKDLGKLKYFLGLEVQYHSGGKIFVNQAKYARDLIKKASMDTCKPCSTPSKPHHQVLKDEGTPLPNPTLFRSIVGALQYLTFTRPDIAFAVNTVCQFMHILQMYLQGTLQFGVTFSPGSMVLSGFCDADWAGDPNTRRSTTGYVVFLGSNPISWSSKKQASVSRSSTEAEYRALAHCAADISWIRQVLCDLHMIIPEAPLLHSDNLSALALSANPVFHSRIKHLDVDFHFIRERVQSKDLIVQYVPTDEQVADILTKGLHSPIFLKHCSNLSLGSSPAELEGGVNNI